MKMTAAVFVQQGLPRPYAVSQPMRIEHVDLEGPGEGEVLIQIAGAGLCHSDLSAIEGNRPRALPAVGGHEAAGIVVETGPGVTRVKAGDHAVMLFVASCGSCDLCRSGRPNLCQSSWQARAQGTLQSGARRISLNGKPINHYSGISCFAEYAVVSERSLMPIPKTVPLLDAAIMGCAVPERDIPRFVSLFLDGKLPVDRLRSDVIGFDQLNAGFDRLADGLGVRQILKCN